MTAAQVTADRGSGGVSGNVSGGVSDVIGPAPFADAVSSLFAAGIVAAIRRCHPATGAYATWHHANAVIMPPGAR